MSKVTGIELGRVLCDALGISQENVCRIKLIADVKDGAKVEVTRFLTAEQVSKIETATEQYQIEEKTGD